MISETHPKKISDFMTINKELDPPGSIFEDKTYEFSFSRFDKPYESYYGTKAKIR
jgi:hypothetical protein